MKQKGERVAKLYDEGGVEDASYWWLRSPVEGSAEVGYMEVDGSAAKRSPAHGSYLRPVFWATMSDDFDPTILSRSIENVEGTNRVIYTISLHEHEWTYTAEGATITARCAEGCAGGYDKTPATLTISAPTLETYGQKGEGISSQAVIIDERGIQGDAEVVYYKADESGARVGGALVGAPTDAGTYWAEITLGEGSGAATAHVVYEIAKAASVPARVTAAAGAYTGKAQPLVTVDDSALEGGTMLYALSDGATAVPAADKFAEAVPTGTDAGTYYVWYMVKGDGNHDDFSPVCIAVTIARTDPAPSSGGSSGGTTGGSAQKASIARASVTLEFTSYFYDGEPKRPAVTSVVLDGKELKADRDYTVAYANNVYVGIATATVVGTGVYEGSAWAAFAIVADKAPETPSGGTDGSSSSAVRADISQAQVTLKRTSYTYDGEPKQPAAKVVLGGKELKEGADYALSYSANTDVGTATAIVVGTGSYDGAKAVTFKIAPTTNTLTVKVTKKAVAFSGKARTVAPIVKAATKYKAKVTFAKATGAKAKKLSGYRALSVNKKAGKVTVKAGTWPGTYKLMVKVSAAKTANTKAASKTVTVKVKVTADSKKLLRTQSAAPLIAVAAT